jgi:hypothetical protein
MWARWSMPRTNRLSRPSFGGRSIVKQSGEMAVPEVRPTSLQKHIIFE